MNYSERIIVHDRFLNTQKSAHEVRTKIIEHISKNKVVLLDIYKADAISFAYSDELFGMLLIFLGKERFKKLIKIRAKFDIINQIDRFLIDKQENQMFCLCRDVEESNVFRLLHEQKNPQQIKETTGLGTGCMWCMEKLENLYNDFVKIPYENFP
jgi:bacterioferritin-associated ferredoxin